MKGIEKRNENKGDLSEEPRKRVQGKIEE